MQRCSPQVHAIHFRNGASRLKLSVDLSVDVGERTVGERVAGRTKVRAVTSFVRNVNLLRLTPDSGSKLTQVCQSEKL